MEEIDIPLACVREGWWKRQRPVEWRFEARQLIATFDEQHSLGEHGKQEAAENSADLIAQPTIALGKQHTRECFIGLMIGLLQQLQRASVPFSIRDDPNGSQGRDQA